MNIHLNAVLEAPGFLITLYSSNTFYLFMTFFYELRFKSTFKSTNLVDRIFSICCSWKGWGWRNTLRGERYLPTSACMSPWLARVTVSDRGRAHATSPSLRARPIVLSWTNSCGIVGIRICNLCLIAQTLSRSSTQEQCWIFFATFTSQQSCMLIVTVGQSQQSMLIICKYVR